MEKSIFILLIIGLVVISTVNCDPEEYDENDEAEPNQINEKEEQPEIGESEDKPIEDANGPGLYGAPHSSQFASFFKPSPLKYGGAYEGADSGADYRQESIAKEFYAGPGHTYYRKPQGALASHFAQYEGPKVHYQVGKGVGDVSELLGHPVNTIYGKGHGPLVKPAAVAPLLYPGGHYDPLFAPLFNKEANLALKVAHPIPAKSALFAPVKPLFAPAYNHQHGHPSLEQYLAPKAPILPLKPFIAGPLHPKSYLSELLLDDKLYRHQQHNYNRNVYNNHVHHYHHHHAGAGLLGHPLGAVHSGHPHNNLPHFDKVILPKDPHHHHNAHLNHHNLLNNVLLPLGLGGHHHSNLHHHAEKGSLPLDLVKSPLDFHGYPAALPKKVHVGPVSGIHSVIPSLSYGFSYKLVPESLHHHHLGLKASGHGLDYHGHGHAHSNYGHAHSHYGHGGLDLLDKAVATDALKSVPAVVAGIHGIGQYNYGSLPVYGHHHHH